MALTFVNTNPGHNKFWTIHTLGRVVVCTWGAIGSWRQAKAYNFSTPWAARKFADRKTTEKINHGYSLVSSSQALDLSK